MLSNEIGFVLSNVERGSRFTVFIGRNSAVYGEIIYLVLEDRRGVCFLSSSTSRGLQKHRYTDYLSDYVYLVYGKNIRHGMGGRMWLENHRTAAHRTPAASISAAMLQEIDRAVEFASPTTCGDSPPVFIDQDE